MPTNESYKEEFELLKKEFEEFTYIVSHDFKAPIRSISNLSSWIEEDLGENLSDDVAHNLELLKTRAKRLEQMMDALLLYSRVNSHNNELAETSVEDLITEAIADYDGRINLIIPEPLPVFVTYRHKLNQVFTNLIKNAVTFSNKDVVRLVVTCSEADEQFYEFCFTDNGVGVPDSAFEKIFTLFYTISPKDTLDTTGAGLAITKKIVQFVHGTIRAEHNHENGLTIRFRWPKQINKAL